MAERGWEATARAHRAGATLIVFLFAATLLFLLMDRTVNIFDEGLVLTNAMRTLSGDVVHRDYNSPYGPAPYYALAGLFSLFHSSFIIARMFGIAIMAAIVAMVFALLVVRTRLVICLIFSALVGGWMLASPYYLYPLFPCLLLALVGSALVLRSRLGQESWPLFLAGCCTGAAALFRYDGGFFLLVAHMAGLATLLALHAGPKQAVSRLIRAALVYGCGVGLVFLPGAVAYLATGSISGFVADIIGYALHYYAKMRGLPFPNLGTVLRHPAEAGVYLPLVASVLALFELVTLWRRRRTAAASQQETGGDFDFLALFTVLTVVFYYKGVVRVSTVHMLMSTIPACLLMAVVANRWWAARGRLRLGAIAALIVAALPSVAAAKSELRADLHDPSRTFLGWAASRGAASDAPSEAGCPVRRATKAARTSADYAAISNYLHRFSAPNERIFVGLSRHDKIFENPVGLYFLAERMPGTHWHQFDPGLQTRADIQQQMVSDLARNRIRWVIRDASFDYMNEPNGSSQSSGVHVLDQYIGSHFRAVARAGQVEVWMPIGSLAPTIPTDAMCMPKPIVADQVARVETPTPRALSPTAPLRGARSGTR